MKAVIVDDEELARKRLYGLLTELRDMEVPEIFDAALPALNYIEKYPVDVVFLDINMPEMDGMELANRLLTTGNAPEVVFVTGYEEYAVAAFELNVTDYLLKPISRERLAKTMQRLTKMGQCEAHRLYITCFGGFCVSVRGDGDEIISWRSPKVEELFAFLVCRGSVSRDEIADTLWGGFTMDRAMKNLNSTVYYIRKALQQYGLEECIVTTRRQVSLDVTKISCDLYEFERLQKSAWSTEQELERLNDLYRGELFQGKIYEWSFFKEQTLEISMISNLLKAAKLRDGQGQPGEAERLYLRALDLNPFHEEAYRKLRDLYIRTGRKEKLKQLRRETKQLLSEEAPLPLLPFRKRP